MTATLSTGSVLPAPMLALAAALRGAGPHDRRAPDEQQISREHDTAGRVVHHHVTVGVGRPGSDQADAVSVTGRMAVSIARVRARSDCVSTSSDWPPSRIRPALLSPQPPSGCSQVQQSSASRCSPGVNGVLVMTGW